MEVTPMADQAWGYAFGSEHSLDAMGTILNGAGPWTWQLRDSSRYGDYLNCRPADGCRVRIHDMRQLMVKLPADSADEERPYRFTAEIGSAAEAERDEFDRTVRELLTRLDARDVVACEPFD